MSERAHRRWAEIGSRIRTARTEAGFSQAQLADEVGTSRRHMIRLERGEHRPGKPMLARIAKATGRETKWIDPEADEDQLVSALIVLLRLHVRAVVRAEVEAIARAEAAA